MLKQTQVVLHTKGTEKILRAELSQAIPYQVSDASRKMCTFCEGIEQGLELAGLSLADLEVQLEIKTVDYT